MRVLHECKLRPMDEAVQQGRHARPCAGHPRLRCSRARKPWMAGTSPAMTKKRIRFPAFRKSLVGRLLGSQAIMTTRHEIDKSTIAQILKLLTNLRLDVLVAGIEIAEM